MKKLIVLLGILMWGRGGAQTAQEWTRQEETQLRYLEEQNGALRVYTGQLKNGYALVREGLGTIAAIRGREWSLHQDYFGALSRVKGEVARWAGVVDITALHKGIIRRAASALQAIRTARELSPAEVQYLQNACSAVVNASLENWEETGAVLRFGALQMDDAVRLRRIAELRERMGEHYVFIQSLERSLRLLAGARVRERAEINRGYRINGVK